MVWASPQGANPYGTKRSVGLELSVMGWHHPFRPCTPCALREQKGYTSCDVPKRQKNSGQKE